MASGAEGGRDHSPGSVDGKGKAPSQRKPAPPIARSTAELQNEQPVVAKNKTHDDGDARRDRMRLGIEVTVLILIAFGAYFTYVQMKEGKRSADAAVRQLDATNRPVLTIDLRLGRGQDPGDKKILLMMPGSPIAADAGTSGPGLHFSYLVTNIGNSVANSIIIPMRIGFLNDSSSMDALRKAQHAACTEVRGLTKGQFDYGPVKPNDHFIQSNHLALADAMPPVQATTDGRPTGDIVIVGCIDYYTQQGFRHETGFMYQVIPPKQLRSMAELIASPLSSWVMLPVPGSNFVR